MAAPGKKQDALSKAFPSGNWRAAELIGIVNRQEVSVGMTDKCLRQGVLLLAGSRHVLALISIGERVPR